MENISKYSNRPIDPLSIDCVIFGFNQESLKLLVVKHAEGISAGKWALPGGWINYNEGIDQAANRLLSELTGLDDIYLEQLKAFGEVERFPDTRVITIAYYALVMMKDYNISPGFTASDAKWVDMAKVPPLIYDHNDILKFAVKQLKHKVRHEPIGFNLLPEKFTLLELQTLYEAILGNKLDKPNFRRKILKMDLLIACKEKQTNVSHRAANLFRFDVKVYRKLKKKGFVFEF